MYIILCTLVAYKHTWRGIKTYVFITYLLHWLIFDNVLLYTMSEFLFFIFYF